MMSCYVDRLFVLESRNPQAFRVGEKHGHQWCHLWADTLEELHAMAAKVGMKRAWFQSHGRLPHYDLVPPRRAQAVRFGAIEFCTAAWRRGERPKPAGQMELKGYASFESLIAASTFHSPTAEEWPEIVAHAIGRVGK